MLLQKGGQEGLGMEGGGRQWCWGREGRSRVGSRAVSLTVWSTCGKSGLCMASTPSTAGAPSFPRGGAQPLAEERHPLKPGLCLKDPDKGTRDRQ